MVQLRGDEPVKVRAMMVDALDEEREKEIGKGNDVLLKWKSQHFIAIKYTKENKFKLEKFGNHTFI